MQTATLKELEKVSQSFARGVSILDLFSASRPRLTLEEIAEEIGISAITAYRYVKVLAESDMLTINDGSVQLSSKILRFINIFWEQDQLVTAAKDHINNLQQQFNETIALCELENNNVVCVYRLESTMSLRSSFRIGQEMSIHAGSFARCISAFLPQKSMKKMMKQLEWTAFTDKTITDSAKYEERLELIRERGYDISIEEVDIGLIALAVPILLNGKVLASLGMALPTIRYDSAELPTIINNLKEAARLISEELAKNTHYVS